MNIRISKGSSIATINPHGAYLYELSESGKTVLFPYSLIPDPNGNIKKRGGSHVCLPNFGAPGPFSELAQHGFGRILDWKITELTGERVRLELLGEGQYKDLNSTLVYVIADKSITVSLVLENRGAEPLAVAPGFHPYFPTQPGEESFLVNGERLYLNELEGTVFRDNVTKVELSNRSVYFSTENMGRFAIWTDRLGDYVCVEPTYSINSFDQNPSASMSLPAGQTARFAFMLSWD